MTIKQMTLQSRAELAGLSGTTKSEFEAWLRNVLQMLVSAQTTPFASPVIAEIEGKRYRIAQRKLSELREMFEGVEVSK